MATDFSPSSEVLKRALKETGIKKSDDSFFSFLDYMKVLPSKVRGEEFKVTGTIGDLDVNLVIKGKGEDVKLYRAFITYLQKENKK
jgi:hypothetical protein